MKFLCRTDQFKKALNRATVISNRNITLPILSNVILIAENDSVVIRSTNLQVGFEETVPIKIEKSGSVAIESSLLVNTINNIIDKEINIELINKELIITSQGVVNKLKTQSVDDFPTLPKIKPEKTIKVPAQDFVRGVKSVSYAALLSDIKPEISSVLISNSGDMLIFVATDSFRLAEKKISIKNISIFDSILFPIKNINEIIKILSDDDSDIELEISNNQCSIKSSKYYITSRILDGAFPDYTQIIPKDPISKVTILKSELQRVLKISHIFHDSLNTLKISLNRNNSNIILETSNNEVGASKSEINGKIEGEDMEVIINQRYLEDVLVSLSDDNIKLLFHGENKPILVKGVESGDFLYLIMPMHQ